MRNDGLGRIEDVLFQRAKSHEVVGALEQRIDGGVSQGVAIVETRPARMSTMRIVWRSVQEMNNLSSSFREYNAA